MQIPQHPHHLPQIPLSLSSSNAISLLPNLSSLSLRRRPPTTTIRMGGGPRTFPGGVSKWQWKRMQAKKAKQLLKARLSRERHIYEMRKRAELKAAVADLERPWEVVQRSVPNTALFSVGADEQLKVLADRFQKPGGFDLWSDDDGPQVFHTADGLPTARFFPKGVVHSVKPYGVGTVGGDSGMENEEKGFYRDGLRDLRGRRNGKLRDGEFVDGIESSEEEDSDDLGSRDFYGGERERNREVESFKHDGQSGFSQGGLRSRRGRRNGRNSSRRLGTSSSVGVNKMPDGQDSEFSGSRGSYSGDKKIDLRRSKIRSGGVYKNGDGMVFRSQVENGAKFMDAQRRNAGSGMRGSRRRYSARGRYPGRLRHSHSEDTYDMSLQRDGSYGFGISDDET